VSTSDLGRRLGVAGVGIPLGIALIWLGPWAVAVALGAVAAAGTAELYRLARARGLRPFGWLGVPSSALLVLAAAKWGSFGVWSANAFALVIGVAVVSLAFAMFLRRADQAPLASVAVTLFAPVYVGAALAFGVFLRVFPFGTAGPGAREGSLALFFVLAISWVGDTGAYFTGHRFGRRKLLPAVSPAKTVEGALGGLAGAVGTALLAASVPGSIAGAFDLDPLPAVLFGLVIGVVSQLGDLMESYLKREAGVKDAGSLFPGHGGVLDRFDGVLLALPVAYLILPLFLP
jgi:phosphatidate cytidylyltransferase